jgi:hypothetical protein
MSNIDDVSKVISGVGVVEKCRRGVGVPAEKNESCIVTSCSGTGVEELSEAAGLPTGLFAGISGGLSNNIESGNVSIALIIRDTSLLRAALGAVGLAVNVASSNGLHLKSFLYPPHVTLLL